MAGKLSKAKLRSLTHRAATICDKAEALFADLMGVLGVDDYATDLADNLQEASREMWQCLEARLEDAGRAALDDGGGHGE